MSASFIIRWQSVRTSILVLVLLGVLYSSYRIGQAFAEWREPRVVVPANPSAFDLNPLAAALTDGGQWSFANLAWDIRSRVLPVGDVESRIASIVPAPPAIDPTHLPDASHELMRFIASAHLIPIEQAGAQ